MYRGMPSRRSLVPAFLTAAILALALNAHSSAPDRLYVRAKKSPVISDWAAAAIDGAAKAGRAKVWVFFTDKGFFDDRGMMAEVAQKNTALPARAASRRVKMERDRVMFLDLPVRDVYVDRVRDLGAELRRSSRWLNAASFEIDVSQLNTLAALPFVHEIRPVITLRRIDESPGSESSSSKGMPGDFSAGVLDVLNYGPSLEQLTQINVPNAHIAGYRGQGVRVCMMDTGYRKDHIVFASAYAEGRVIAEYDFVFNDGNTQDSVGQDAAGQHSHGTLTWSTLGGELDGTHYGPAFESEFLLAKTEYVPTETQVEEDNWVAGMEWADMNGADVISSSLAYSDWYVTANYNGDFCVTTKAADSAAVLGIVVCNSMGNSGPGASTLAAPADADSIISVGAVDASGTIASFSSRGPTADGRMKPELCARGVSTSCATSSTTTSFGSASGTSLSCPLVGGAVAVVLSAHPTWTPMQVREALMMTASQFCSPNNNYGWGIIDVMAAINYDGCTEPGAPNAPITTDPTPCANVSYSILWSTKPCATGYQLFENAILIYDGPLTQQTLSRASGSFTYTVKGKNACGAGVAGPAGGATTIQSTPAAPSAPLTSNPSPCGPENYTVSWTAVSLASAYELYENNALIYDGANLNFTTNHAAGSYSYHVIAKNTCAAGPQSATGAATSINVCNCHGDPNCDGAIDVLDVVMVVNEAFRGMAGTADPSCTHVSRNDVDCDCAVSVTDVVHVVNVAFRGASKALEFCNACVSPCP